MHPLSSTYTGRPPDQMPEPPQLTPSPLRRKLISAARIHDLILSRPTGDGRNIDFNYIQNMNIYHERS